MKTTIEYYNILEKTTLRNNLKKVIKQSLKMVRPRPKISIIDWAEKNIYLRDPIPGPFRIKNSPHLRAVFEAFDDPTTRKISIMASSQVGKTLLMMIIWAYYADIDPSGMLIMHPTDREVQIFADTKLDPLIEDSPILKSKIGSNTRGSIKGSTTRRKFFPGGWTEIITGSSTGTTRQRSAKRTMADDIDAIEFTTASEGDHTSNLEKRTTTFKYDYLHINISTPLLEGSSRIQKKYDLGSRGEFYVQCTECKEWFIPDDDCLTYDKELDIFGVVIKNYPKTAALVCKNCGSLYTEDKRYDLIRNGKVIHQDPDNPHKSFRFNQFQSTLSSLENCAIEKIAALEDPEKMESYYNTVRGIPYNRKRGESIDPLSLMDSIEDYINPDNPLIPNDVLLITGSADIQRGTKEKPPRIEMEFWGWGLGEEAWLLHRVAFIGNAVNQEVWDKLFAYVDNLKFIRTDGLEISISRIFFDSGDQSESVYSQLSGKFQRGFIPIKGANNYGASLLPRSYSRVGKNNNTLLLVLGTQAAKGELMSRLEQKKQNGPKKLHFPRMFCNAEYFKQLTAEHLVKRNTGMITYYVYEKKEKNSANEAFDLLTYNYCAMKHCLPNFNNLKLKYDTESAELNKENKVSEVIETPKKTNTWGGYKKTSGWGDYK